MPVPSLLPILLGLLPAQSPAALPHELRPFVPKGFVAEEWHDGDLDRDGRPDALLVAAQPLDEEGTQDAETTENGEERLGRRMVIVLRRGRDGALKEWARNGKAAPCRLCGSASLGDPYQGIEVAKGRFSILHHGGQPGVRWDTRFDFGWSRRDSAWQLLAAKETLYDLGNEANPSRELRSRPPKDFGLIDFRDFDPDRYQGEGKR